MGIQHIYSFYAKTKKTKPTKKKAMSNDENDICKPASYVLQQITLIMQQRSPT